ncbi:hypothetical protein ACFOHT_08505 [Massilia oculi]|uniref:hypothetical protein n=1 Tax=Massilia oculi TaxID=945844 RepID=UPI0013B446CC|nr:hypothetical protein [Massilia oculi]
MNTPKTILAVLLAATAIGAGAQTTGTTQGQPATGATYRPSLDGQQATAPAPTIDMRPMTQEEKATGRQEPSRLKDIDPATHPAPQNVRPQPSPVTMPRPQDSQAVPPSARITPAPATAPAPVGPSARPVSACTGATCTDASGATTAGQVGNASVNSEGRLCNRTGNTMQCF